MALDEKGQLIHISNAVKGEHYFCPICKKEYILRKSGKKGKGSRRPHFAHNELTPNCNPESVLHYSFKKLLLENLENLKEKNKPFEFNWKCMLCGESFSGNLLENVVYIKEEYSLQDCRPDIALLDEKNKFIAAIEIVVTHMPDEKTLQYYRENGIVLIRIDLVSEACLTLVEEISKKPDFVDYCINPFCYDYDGERVHRRIMVIQDKCGRCLNSIEKYYIEINGIFGKTITRNFLDEEIEYIKAKRNNIEVKVDNSRKQKYPVCVCINCKINKSKYRNFRF